MSMSEVITHFRRRRRTRSDIAQRPFPLGLSDKYASKCSTADDGLLHEISQDYSITIMTLADGDNGRGSLRYAPCTEETCEPFIQNASYVCLKKMSYARFLWELHGNYMYQALEIHRHGQMIHRWDAGKLAELRRFADSPLEPVGEKCAERDKIVLIRDSVSVYILMLR